MSTDAVGVSVPAPPDAGPALDSTNADVKGSDQQTPAFLHSPPDSNNTIKSEASDSELSELEDEPVLDGARPKTPPPHSAEAKPEQEEDEDIGEVLPDHWSGTVPVFKPTMHQFKDFQRFVSFLFPTSLEAA